MMREQLSLNERFLEAARTGNLARVKEALAAGADLRTGHDYALKSASMNGHLEVIKYLLEAGADLHAWNDYAFRWACREGHLEVVKFLVEENADIHGSNNSALREAYKNKHTAVVDYLFEKGVWEKKDKEGISALMNVARGECGPELIKAYNLFLDRKAAEKNAQEALAAQARVLKIQSITKPLVIKKGKR